MQKEAQKEVKKIKKQNAKLRKNTIFDTSIENRVNKADVKTVTTRKKKTYSDVLDQPSNKKTKTEN